MTLPTWKSMLVVVVLPTLLVADAGADPPSRRPNIVFILADDLGYTDLGCQGSPYYKSPAIDRMASEGLRFTNAYTCGPNCQPTRAALMSGQYGPRTGVYTVGSIERFDWRSRSLRPVDNVEALPLDRETVADALRRAGYVTGMFGKWHLGNDDDHHPSKRGFDEAIVSAGRHFDFVTVPPVEHPKDIYLADFLTDRAVDFVRRHRDKPFFLYLPHFAVHSPHQAKEPLIERFKSERASGGHHDPTYAAMIASVDESVARILATLDELNLAENTLVIFTSDNGGVGGYVREGIRRANDITDNAPLRGGKGMLNEGGIRVPFLARWRGTIAPIQTCDRPIISVDLFPTLLELTSAAAPKDQVLDGVSFAGALTSTGKPLADRGPLFWHFPGYLGAGQGTWRTTPVGVVRDGPWKLLEYFEDGRIELYNLESDVGERNNLAAKEPQRVSALHARMKEWRKEIAAPMPRPITAGDPKHTPAKKKRAKRSPAS